MNLSDVFKFTQGLGQKGHQIGRKVGDAIELLTLGMIKLEDNLVSYLVIEDGVEGATSAKHKVEFSFYHLNAGNNPSKKSEDLFGIIECKKVGVEQTIKANFKLWKAVAANKHNFYETDGYSFIISPGNTDYKWLTHVSGEIDGENNIKIRVDKIEAQQIVSTDIYKFNCNLNSQALVAVDVNNNIFVLAPGQKLSEIENHITKCIVIEIKELSGLNVSKINVNESLPGPQTPEKAKQASFVSLDVRKKVLGHFDKTEDKSFISILVIGEASHWENKSRSMIRLCNDYNLIIPDAILIYLFEKFEEKFGENYQDRITKTSYKNNVDVRELISEIITHFERRVMYEMEIGNFVVFKYSNDNGANRLIVEEL